MYVCGCVFPEPGNSFVLYFNKGASVPHAHHLNPEALSPICTPLLPELVLSLILTSLMMGLLSGYHLLVLLMYPLAAQRALMRK